MAAPTEKQLNYVESIRAKLSLPKRMVDDHCQTTFRRPFAALDRRQVSELLDAMIGWEADEAALRRAQGQTELPGFGP